MKLAVISDIHSDFQSLEKAFRRIWNAGCDKILCLGDIVGFSYHYADFLDGRDPDACIQMISEHCDVVICGNHDLHAVQRLPSDHVDLGMTENWYELDLGSRAEMAQGKLWLYDDEIDRPVSEASAEFLKQLPELSIIPDPGFNILATHFIYPDLTGSRTASPSKHEDFRKHLKLVKKKRCLVGLAGHAHLEGYAQISMKAFGMNYFRKAEIIKRPQIIIVPALTRSKARNGYLILDTEKYNFEAIPLD